MKLMHPLFSYPIHFQENRIPVLIIENASLLREMVMELFAQSENKEGRFVLSIQDNVLDCASCLHIIYDYAHIHAPDKKLQTKLIAALLQEAQEALAQESVFLHQSIQNYLGALASLADYPTSYDDSENLFEVLKAMNFRVDLQDLSIAEALAEHISLYHRLLKNQCFVLLHAKAFFTPTELRQLYDLAQYQKWNLLLIESSACKERLAMEDPILFDADLCELRIEKNRPFV